MTVLREATELWGNATLIESDPGEELCSQITFMPFRQDVFFDHDQGWGVYDRDGQLVQAAGYYRGPEKRLVGQSEAIEVATKGFDYFDEAFVYGGPVILHYGHFLTATLPRLWQLARQPGPRRRIICHAHEGPEFWFAHDFIRDIFGALGLTEADFFRPESPCVLRRLYVPRPAMEEQNFVHRALGELARLIGNFYNVAADSDRLKAVYISKTRLATGVTRFADEQILEQLMAEHGVTILHPQEVAFADQLRTLARANVITGTAGSALHSSMFLSRPSRIVALTGHNVINSNYALIDRLTGNDSLYLRPAQPALDISDQGGFNSTWKMDMAACARALLEHV